MTKNNIFVRKECCDQCLFLSNFFEIVNEFSFKSFVYIVDSYDV